MGNTALHQERGDVLEPYLWRNRVLLLFSPDAEHPDFVRLRDSIEARKRDAADRDLVVVESLPVSDPADHSESAFSLGHEELCKRFEVDERGFTAVLVSKDGVERARYHAAVDPDVLFAKIDESPRRQEELIYRQQQREFE